MGIVHTFDLIAAKSVGHPPPTEEGWGAVLVHNHQVGGVIPPHQYLHHVLQLLRL